MNNIKVLEHALKQTETGDSDTWQKLQATLFLDLIKMRQKAWSKMVDEMAIDASRAESYEPSGMVEAFEKKIAHDGFYSELRNPEGDNVAECADRVLVACLKSSWRTRAALRWFFEEKVEFLKCSRMRD
jgi:hypothetical protein